MFRMMKGFALQYNQQHSKAVISVLNRRFQIGVLDLALIQQPCVRGDEVLGLKCCMVTLFYAVTVNLRRVY